MTNVTRFAGLITVLLTACMTREPSVKPTPDLSSSLVGASGVWTPPVASVAGVASVLPPPTVLVASASDEPLIQEYRDLVRK